MEPAPPNPPQPAPPPAPAPPPPPPPARRSRLAVAAFLLGLAGPLACGVGPFLALLVGAVAEGRIRASGGALRGRGWIRLGVLLSFAWLALLWEGRDRILSLVMSRVSSWENLPPLDPGRVDEMERALDRLSRFDMRSRVEGKVRLEQAGEAAVPHLVNRLGVLEGLGALRLGRRVRNLVDSRDRIREILVLLTFRDFGLDASAWRRWWEAGKEGTREDWALDALLSDNLEAKRRGLEHFAGRREGDPRVLAACLSLVRDWQGQLAGGEPALRAEAYALLVGRADRDFGFDPSRSAEEQPAALAALERWVLDASASGGVLIPAER